MTKPAISSNHRSTVEEAKAFFAAMLATDTPPRPLVSSSAGDPGRMALVSQSLTVRDSETLRVAVREAGATLLNAVQLFVVAGRVWPP